MKTKALRYTSFTVIVYLAVLGGSISGLQSADFPDWYSQSVGYEIFVRSFSDSDGDGIGDLTGIRNHLDILTDDVSNPGNSLGVNTLWLTPIFESPSYHGYDVTNYRKIDPELGTSEDFQHLVDACHQRNVHIILDFPINHTSNKHPWFRAAARHRNSPFRRWYIWRRIRPLHWRRPWEPDGASEDVWHPFGSDYYYGLFCAEMPDLNLRNSEVTEEITDIARFWLKKGVDGFRIDAARYLIETGGGQGQADTRMTLDWIHNFKSALKESFRDIVLICEVWADLQHTACYSGSNGPCDSTFDFPMADAMIQTIREKNSCYLRKFLLERENLVENQCRDSIFLSNHDQDRIASRLPERYQQKAAAALLLTLPGVPYIYYGEEIGMKGTKPDPNIRRPYCWTTGLNESCNATCLNDQVNNPDSLWNHYRRLVHIRKQLPSLNTPFLKWINPKPSGGLIAYVRGTDKSACVVLINISAQPIHPIIMDIFHNSLYLNDIYSHRQIPLSKIKQNDSIHLPELLPGNVQIWISSQ